MEPTARYVIKSVRLTACPPVGDLEIQFGNRLNVISGENGVGKSSLTSALRCKKWPHGGIVEIEDEGDRRVFEETTAVCIISEDFVFDQDEARTESHWVCLAESHPRILEIASRLLNQLIRSKLGGWMTKFADIPDHGDQTFFITVRRGHRPRVMPGQPLLTDNFDIPSCYSDISDLFVALGERFVVHLAGVLAAREYLQLRCPLIVDSAFRMLDEHHCAGVMSILANLEDQVIVLELPDTVEKFIKGNCKDTRYVPMPSHWIKA
jgi:hypothetical protein